MEHGAPWSCGQEFSHLVGRSNDVILKAAKENGLTCCHLERKKVVDLSKQDSLSNSNVGNGGNKQFCLYPDKSSGNKYFLIIYSSYLDAQESMYLKMDND
jgi:hypothetical protein